jgi:hypothetical protein
MSLAAAACVVSPEEAVHLVLEPLLHTDTPTTNTTSSQQSGPDTLTTTVTEVTGLTYARHTYVQVSVCAHAGVRVACQHAPGLLHYSMHAVDQPACLPASQSRCE